MRAGEARSLAGLRTAIEEVDAKLIATLAERIALARAVGEVKARGGQPVIDPTREAAVVARAVALARSAGLAGDEIRALYWRILAMARRAQLDAAN
jgi:chorismate mutase